MNISELFKKDIARPINGVVKADQLDEASVWQELDEFVVTAELRRHLGQFFERYREGVDHPGDPSVAGSIGVWVSGFFGSGKSHFIKVLSHLLENAEHRSGSASRKAVEFFDDKISDAMILGDIHRAVAAETDVILFNIDSKADSSSGRDAILAVFLKVLNGKLGYSPDHAHIAHMERYLDEKGKLQEFHDAFRRLTGTEWVDERDAYEFNRDEVVEALTETLGQSRESCERWVDNGESTFSLTIENFAKWVKEYLDKCGSKRRLIFLVDEVGQFIGGDTALMLNLQTITEQLGTVCNGRAWVVVTSQEDIDAVLGEMRTSRENDFSKIQGRFRTRLSLSSGNVDEVIQERLLRKNENAGPELARLYTEKGDILKNQLSFHDSSGVFRQYQDAEDFQRVYPFAPYQFKLLQRIFETIRKAGATGLHLAQGERSLLDAFQHAAGSVLQESIGVLVPLYRFYPSIESFLDTTVKRTIDHAASNSKLEPFDISVLQILFLIRYVEEMRGNVDNLVTLCIDQVDADRLALKRKIEASLGRLEGEHLVNRNGDLYYFLTNEERDIQKEIEKERISSAEEARTLGALIFEDLLKEQRKHRYSVTRKDIPFNRVCDHQLIGRGTEGDMTVAVITPLDDDYKKSSDAQCTMVSSSDGGKVIIRLDDNSTLGRELKTYLKTDKYLKTRDDSTAPQTTRRIHKELAGENQQRRTMLANLLSEMLVEASWFAAGEPLSIGASSPVGALTEALEYLIQNTFTRMGALQHLCEHPDREMTAIIKSDDTAMLPLDDVPEHNPKAMELVRDHIRLSGSRDRELVVHDLCTSHFSNRPFGWPEKETALLLVRLYAAGEIQFLRNGEAVRRDDLAEAMTQERNWRRISIVPRITSSVEDLKKARELGRDVFQKMGPENEDGLFGFLRGYLREHHDRLERYAELAAEGTYPGSQTIADCLRTVQPLLKIEEPHRFFERFNADRAELHDLSEDYADLSNFFEKQKRVWDQMLSAEQRFEPNRQELMLDEQTRKSLRRLQEIREAPQPYGLIHEIEPLLTQVRSTNESLLQSARERAQHAIDAQIEDVQQDLAKFPDEPELAEKCLSPLQNLRSRIASQISLPHLQQTQFSAISARDEATAILQRFVDDQESAGADTVGEDDQKPSPSIAVFRGVHVVNAAEVLELRYLETQEDVELFLKTLREQMEAAVAANKRIEVR